MRIDSPDASETEPIERVRIVAEADVQFKLEQNQLLAPGSCMRLASCFQ